MIHSDTRAIDSERSAHDSSIIRNAAALPSLLDITLDDIGDGYLSGSFTCRTLTSAYLRRIQEVNGDVRAVIETNPDALSIADQLDGELRCGKSRGPLHGVPILIKDNIVTEDRMEASAGSYALVGAKPALEAYIVTKLRMAGAVILGKANLTEFCYFRSDSQPDGWSARGGQTINAYHPQATPSGSSGGSAVATALGLCFAAIGTETDGSLTYPASLNNIVTIKPTVGLTSRDGTIPITLRQDTTGPMTRNVKDAATILSIIAGESPLDHATALAPSPIPNYGSACTTTSLTGIRIGIPRNALRDCTKTALAAFEAALSILTTSGATIVDFADLTALSVFSAWDDRSEYANVPLTDYSTAMSTYLSTLSQNPNNLRSVADLRQSILDDPRELPDSIDTVQWDRALEYAERGIDSRSVEYARSLEKNGYFAGEGGILGALERCSCDVLIFPEAASPCVTLAARPGLPIVTVPLGFYPAEEEVVWDQGNGLMKRGDGLPFGLCFVGRKWSEETLVRVAFAFEQGSRVRSKGLNPWIVPSTELPDVV